MRDVLNICPSDPVTARYTVIKARQSDSSAGYTTSVAQSSQSDAFQLGQDGVLTAYQISMRSLTSSIRPSYLLSPHYPHLLPHVPSQPLLAPEASRIKLEPRRPYKDTLSTRRLLELGKALQVGAGHQQRVILRYCNEARISCHWASTSPLWTG